jgi:hypothetical protein
MKNRTNELEAEALNVVLGHRLLGDPNGPRMVDARENKDGTVSVFINGAEESTHQADFSLREDMSWEVVVDMTKAVKPE